MLIKSLTGLLLVRRRVVSLRLGDAVGKPLFCRSALCLATQGALTGHSQIDDPNHA
jgi:hypothetical protein